MIPPFPCAVLPTGHEGGSNHYSVLEPWAKSGHWLRNPRLGDAGSSRSQPLSRQKGGSASLQNPQGDLEDSALMHSLAEPFLCFS